MGDDARQQEDALIRRVFSVALREDQLPASPNAKEPCTLLASLGQEIDMDESSPALLDKSGLDRLVVARLIEAPPGDYPQSPLQYLMRCYARAADEARGKHVAASAELQATVQLCKELAINYAGLTLVGGIVPHLGATAEAAERRGALQLLDALDARLGSRAAPAGSLPLPPGFLEDLAAKFVSDGNAEGLQELVVPVAKELARRVKSCSVLGDYSPALNGVRLLVGIEPVALALASAPEFLPNLKDITGRGIESPGSSWLGPCFCPSLVDDPLVKSQPNVGEQCFHNVESRRPGDIQQSMRALQLASKQHRNELVAITKSLLGKSTRQHMVRWLAGVVEGNGERAKMQWSLEKGASHGFFLNHNAVMLSLAGPFLDSPNFWKRVDVRFLATNTLLDFKEDTKLGASMTEDAAWRERVVSGASASSSNGTANGSSGGAQGQQIEYHFICECFFLALKSLHLGLAKLLDDLDVYSRELGRYTQEVRALEAEVERMQASNSPQAMVANMQLMRTKAHMQAFQSACYEYSTVLQDNDFMGEVLAFYRLLAQWLLAVANPAILQSGSFMGVASNLLPLPETPPVEFTCLPEWFLEDMIDTLIAVSRHYPPLLMSAKCDEIMILMLATMDQPKYVRSSHIRAKMAELLHQWLPQDDVQQPGRMRRFTPRGQLASTVSHLFQGHPVVCERLVPSLLKLYVDVEVMDSRNNFNEKFMYRQYIGELLAHVWELPPHREAWRRFAAEQGTGSNAYVRFTNMLITDATYLLDESLKKVEEVRSAQNKLSDSDALMQMAPQERRELQSALDHSGGLLRAYLSYAQTTIGIMNFSTEEVTATFLLPEMVGRAATMLNYFLSLLTGPERKKLAMKEPEKYNFRPRELLQNLIHVYLHLSSSDRSGAFHAAVANDTRSYSPTMFAEAARVLASAQMLGPVEAARLDALDMGVQNAAAQAAEQEDLLQGVEVPDEFQDPIMAELMTDPVMLPTSNTVMDRANITRHLLTDQRDPMSRAPLTPDMLVPQPELKARIEAWVRETRAARQAAKQQ